MGSLDIRLEDMDQDTVLQATAAVAGVLATWVYNSMLKKIACLEKECTRLSERISANEIIMVGNYVKNDRFEKMEEALFAKLDRIEDKLDRKADK